MDSSAINPPTEPASAGGKEKTMPDIALPVKVIPTAVYYKIVDSEERLICFMGMSENDKARAEYIARLINEDTKG